MNSVPPSKPALRRKSTLNERFTQHDTDRQMRVVNRFVHSKRSAAAVAAPTQVVSVSITINNTLLTAMSGIVPELGNTRQSTFCKLSYLFIPTPRLLLCTST